METNKPQQLLDELHAIGIPELYSAALSSTERKAAVKLAIPKLTLVIKSISHEIAIIKSSYDGSNKLEASIEQDRLAPFILLQNLVDLIDLALAQLVIRDTPGKPPLFQKYIIQFEDGWRIVGAEGVLEKLVQDIRTKIAETTIVIEKAEIKLKWGGSRYLQNAAHLRQHLPRVRGNIALVEKSLDTVTPNDQERLEKFMTSLLKLENFATKIINFNNHSLH